MGFVNRVDQNMAKYMMISEWKNGFCPRLLELTYKQLALGCQIVKQLPGLNPISLNNNKNNRLKKSGVFPL